MTVEGGLSFAKVIEEHLELKRRNSSLDGAMPLDRYQIDDPFENHPLFKSEEQARLEETISGTHPMPIEDELVLASWPVEADSPATSGARSPEDTLWGRSREFDWGD